MEHLDVLIVGAGLSGIGAAHYIKTECPWAEFSVFESRDAIGGTWDIFRYPGIRSDSDMYTLGFSFRPWAGPKTIADGPSILQYIRDTAAEDGTDAKIRFNHRVVGADWSTEEACWHVTAELSRRRIPVGNLVAEHLHGDLRREEAFQSSLEAALEDVVQRAAAAGADEDFVDGVHGVARGAGGRACARYPSTRQNSMA